MKIYANVDSNESISYLKNYDPFLIRIEMSTETRNMLSSLENSSVAQWLMSHNVETASLGEGIVCGVTE